MTAWQSHPAAALHYAGRFGWPVFPVGANKHPLTAHGLLDATTDAELILSWWRRWPNALAAIATGEPSGVVALDIDIRESVNGLDSLDNLGVHLHSRTPTAHTPSGGIHCLFRWPGHFVKTIAGKLGPGLDIRGDGGSLILPPGPGRAWDPHLGLGVPLAEMPSWMHIPEAAPAPLPPRPTKEAELSRYAEVALDRAVAAIKTAPAGAQHDTLNREAFTIGGLVGAGEMPAGLALEALQWAALQMPGFDHRRPWRPADLEKMVRAAFADGIAHPRTGRAA